MKMKPEQKTDLHLVRYLKAPHKSCMFVLGADYVVGDWTVPKGFTTDLASVPVGLRNIVSQLNGIEAAVLHDWMYETKSVPRAEADYTFFLMLEGAVGPVKRHLMYWAVRIGGGWIYDSD